MSPELFYLWLRLGIITPYENGVIIATRLTGRIGSNSKL
jgi:hypothetical protein